MRKKVDTELAEVSFMQPYFKKLKRGGVFYAGPLLSKTIVFWYLIILIYVNRHLFHNTKVSFITKILT